MAAIAPFIFCFNLRSGCRRVINFEDLTPDVVVVWYSIRVVARPVGEGGGGRVEGTVIRRRGRVVFGYG